MSIATAFSESKQMLRRGAFALAVAGLAVTEPAFAQQTTKVALPIPPEITAEVNARLKALAPIIRSAEAERARLGIPEAARDTCAAQTVLYGRTVLAMKNDDVFSYALAKADMSDLENMTRFATCTLPGGLSAKLNVCSRFGNALAGHLTPSVFDPKKIDIRPDTVRCPKQSGQQVSLNN